MNSSGQAEQTATPSAGEQQVPSAAAMRFELRRLLTVDQAAEISQVPARVVRDAVKTGAISYIVLGRQPRIHPEDLEDWWDRRKVKAWIAPTVKPAA